jgi:hypothetical protein
MPKIFDFFLNHKKWLLILLGVGIASMMFFHRAPQPDEWMLEQIKRDFSSFAHTNVSKEKVAQIADDPANDGYLLIHFTIRNNTVSMSHHIPPSHPQAKDCLFPRLSAIKNSIQQILKKHRLPDMDFIVSIHDALDKTFDIPIFVMAKKIQTERQILIPDFEALRGRYQVLTGKDITQDSSVPSWDTKQAKLIWRGGPGQHPPEGYDLSLDPNHPHCLSRITLCRLSKEHQDLIDAKFSYMSAGYESLSCFQGEQIPFESQLTYKYQMQIDGYSCAYSTSGWKFFSNSVVFIEDSPHIQWYFHELKPYVHYIPVHEGLDDLIEKIQWATVHDPEAKSIARQAREFAISHITQEKNRIYLYYALLAYSQLYRS